MFDSNLNWNHSNMISTPWVLSAINPNSDATRMVVQVQTQSSSFAANPEGSLLSTNTIEWFSAGSQPQPALPTNALLDDFKTNPENALVSYTGTNNPFLNSGNGTNGAFLNANNTLVALPSPASHTQVPAILTLTVPSLDFSRSIILQASTPNFARSTTSHDQSTYVTRIVRNVPGPDPITLLQESAAQILSAPAAPTFISGLAPNISQCVRLPFVGEATLPVPVPVPMPVPVPAPSITEIPQTAPQNTWVMVVPDKEDMAETEGKIGTTSYITELPSELSATCSSCGSVISNESSEFSSNKKCSTCAETSVQSPEYITNDIISVDVHNEAIKEPPCTCQNEDKLDWNDNPCEKCKNILDPVETCESDATCQVITTTTTTTVEAAIQATSELDPCLDSTFDSEHEEFEPTSQAISSILRKLLEEEIENTNKGPDDKTLNSFDMHEDAVDNSSFLDLNQSLDTTQDECDGPTTGVKDVLMTGAPTFGKRHLTGSQSRAKKVKTVLESAMRRPTCSKCGDKFSSTLNLRKHYMGNVNDKSYQCSKCKQTFTGCYSYKRHGWTHDKEITGDDPPGNIISESSEEEGIQPYGCAQCGKEFSDCFLLTEHCATHVRGRPFTCTQCEMCFESVALLEKHSKLHIRTKTVLFNGYEAESESSSE